MNTILNKKETFYCKTISFKMCTKDKFHYIGHTEERILLLYRYQVSSLLSVSDVE